MKIYAVCIAIALSIIAGCAARQTRSSLSAKQANVVGFEIKSLPGFVLVDDIEFDDPVTVTRAPCGRWSDCLLWTEGTDKFYRPMQDDWVVTYRYDATVTVAR